MDSFVYLMFAPKRTREYSQTPFDFDHDFFVLRSELVAACDRSTSAAFIGQQIMESLKADCRFWGQPPLALTMVLRIWQDYMPAAWNHAIAEVRIPLHSNPIGNTNRDVVTVVMTKREYKAWDWKYYWQLTPEIVYQGRIPEQSDEYHQLLQSWGEGAIVVEHQIVRSIDQRVSALVSD